MERLIGILLLIIINGCSCHNKEVPRLKEIEDSIRIIKEQIIIRDTIIDSLIHRRDSLVNVERKITLENEKIDSILVNGDWLQNIEFISEYLSKHKDSGN